MHRVIDISSSSSETEGKPLAKKLKVNPVIHCKSESKYVVSVPSSDEEIAPFNRPRAKKEGKRRAQGRTNGGAPGRVQKPKAIPVDLSDDDSASRDESDYGYGGDKSSGSPKHGAASAGPQLWTCAVCTFDNISSHLMCKG